VDLVLFKRVEDFEVVADDLEGLGVVQLLLVLQVVVDLEGGGEFVEGFVQLDVLQLLLLPVLDLAAKLGQPLRLPLVGLDQQLIPGLQLCADPL
jgi:hypothetical protein